MNYKKLSVIALLLTLVLVLVGCAPKAPEATATPVPATEAPAVTATEAPVEVSEEPASQSVELTVEELAQYNGKDGQPAYIAVDGIIYDVTNSAAWKNGQHNGFDAGEDLTSEIKEKSPHGVGKLDNVVEVGKLITK